MRVMTVVGTRPEIIRLSRIIPKLDDAVEHIVVHTGQNYSDNLSDVFFAQLAVRAPNHHLGIATGSLGAQLGSLFAKFEAVLDEVKPDRVLLLGDTNSALVALLCKRRGIPVFHMEAGNRCFDDRVPEEVNRRVIDHCSSILLPYTARSAENLVREGIERQRVFVVGNPMWEVLSAYSAQIEASSALRTFDLRPKEYLLATMHRAENVDDPRVLRGLCTALGEVSALYGAPLILSVHPHTKQRLPANAFPVGHVVQADAMPFFEFVKLQQHAALVLTDSGTVQEECAMLRVPVITIRDTTERPETVECGSNIIASTDPARILAAATYLRTSGEPDWIPPAEYLLPNVSDIVLRILLGNSVASADGVAGSTMPQ